MNYDTTATPLYNHDGTNTPLPLTMPRGTAFKTTIDGVDYPMFASDTHTISFNNGWLFSNIGIEQGTLTSVSYTYQNNTFEHIYYLKQM